MQTKLQPLFQFILARERIRHNKDTGLPRPWTSDPILVSKKFCNVRREDDRTTRWLATNWRTPHETDPDLFFAMVIARRCLNQTETMAELGYPVPWDPVHYLSVVNSRRDRKLPIVSTVYKTVIGGVPGPGPENQVDHLLDPLWASHLQYRPLTGESLASYHGRLGSVKHMGDFYTAQVIADLKYTPCLRDASDWWTFAIPGPGSVRGMNRIMGRPALTGVSFYEEKKSMGSTVSLSKQARTSWLEEVNFLREDMGLAKVLCAQDMQNCLCEFDKYERIRLNEGGRTRDYSPFESTE